MNNIIKTFFEIVQIDSPTGEEKRMADYITSFLKKEGIFVKKDTYGNVYASIRGQGESIFFSSHMDTVEPGRQIKPRIKNNYIVSESGTILGSDNKVAIAAILEIIKHLPNAHRPLELIFTCSEEIGNYGAINFDYSLLSAQRGYCFDLSQPVGTIATASPFYERFDIILIGNPAHASRPEEAKNVLPALAEILHIAPLGKVNNNTFFNIGVIGGGSVRNTILGDVSLQGEIRSFSNQNLIKLKQNFRDNLHKILKKYDLKVKEEWVRENAGYQHGSQEAKEFIQMIVGIYKNIGLKSFLTPTAGVSDANIFNDKGLLCLNLGNGSEFSHTTKERIRLSEVNNLAKLMLALVRI